MNKTTSKNIQVSMDTSCSNVRKKRNHKTTQPEHRNSKSSCTNKQLCDFIELSVNDCLKSKELLETSILIAQPG